MSDDIKTTGIPDAGDEEATSAGEAAATEGAVAEEPAAVEDTASEELAVVEPESATEAEAETAIEPVETALVEEAPAVEDSPADAGSAEKPSIFKDSKKRKFLIGGGAGIAAVIVIVILVLSLVVIPANKYDQAAQALANGDNAEALSILATLGDYKHSKAAAYIAAEKLLTDGEFDVARASLAKMNDATANDYITLADGMEAQYSGDIEEALELIGSVEHLPLAKYELGLINYGAEKYGDAYGYFMDLSKMGKAHADLGTYMAAACRYEQKKYNEAKTLFKELPLNYEVSGVSVYTRLASIELIGTWQIYKWEGQTKWDEATGTNTADLHYTTREGKELEDWGWTSDDGTFNPMAGMKFKFEHIKYNIASSSSNRKTLFNLGNGTYTTDDELWHGVNGAGKGTWNVNSSDIADDGSYHYVFDASSKTDRLDFDLSAKGVLSFYSNSSEEDRWYFKKVS